MAQVSQPGALVVDPVELRKGLHEGAGDRRHYRRLGDPLRRQAGTEDHPTHPLHHVEGGAQDLGVLAVEEWPRHLRIDLDQAREDAVLAAHVVRGLDLGPEGRAPQDQLALADPHQVGEVREAARKLLQSDRRLRLRKERCERPAQPLGIQLLARARLAGRVDPSLVHRREDSPAGARPEGRR